jgi:hypothetical protein
MATVEPEPARFDLAVFFCARVTPFFVSLKSSGFSTSLSKTKIFERLASLGTWFSRGAEILNRQLHTRTCR